MSFTLPSEYPHIPTGLRTHTCGELRLSHVGQQVTLCGWVQKSRDKNHFCFVDLRDRFGITQIVVSATETESYEIARNCGREWVLRVTGTVVKRVAENTNRDTGDIELQQVTLVEVLNRSLTPPFKIEDNTDGREDLRMKYRYLDIRRGPVRNSLLLRHKLSQSVRNYLSSQNFIEIETPYLIKSTPEGARDFIVPSRMNPGCFYALPQSPQTFKQLLMVAGMDRYFQIVRCFRDEELRADRQPEFTQIDCELTFVDQEDVIQIFEGMTKTIFKEIRNIDLPSFPRMVYADAIKYYGCDKPDTRFEMKFVELTHIVKGKGFPLWDNADLVVGICAPSLGSSNKKALDRLIKLAKSPEIGATALVWITYDANKKLASSVDKFYKTEDLQKISDAFEAQPGNLMLIMAGPVDATRVVLGRFRLALADDLKLRDSNVFKPLWVVDFPLLEYNEDDNRWQACHHPFTSALPQDFHLLDTDPGKVRARAYDLVINGSEVGGGSIRIHDKTTQLIMLKRLGLSEEEAEEKFGFLMKAFEYGAPPHGGLAFGLDRLCAILGGDQSIRNFIAFPKNNQGRDTMIEAPSPVDQKQLGETHIRVQLPEVTNAVASPAPAATSATATSVAATPEAPETSTTSSPASVAEITASTHKEQ